MIRRDLTAKYQCIHAVISRGQKTRGNIDGEK
jgi:hypothetical protein